MKRWHRLFVSAASGLGVLAALTSPLAAQGVTTAAVQGLVTSQDKGTPS